MDDFVESLDPKPFFPGRDEGGRSDDLASRVDCTDVFENRVGD